MKIMSDIKPLVAVRILTYNHEKYISQAIDSVLAQKTNFPFTIIIGEDCSTDSTAKICQTYSEKYPLLIKLICNPINDIKRNSLNNFEACFKSGAKYIALQVDFLESNPDYTLCFHPVQIIEPNGALVSDYITKVPDPYETINSLAIAGNYIHTPSALFRSIINPIPINLLLSPIADYFIYMLLAKHGKIKQLPDTMAVYRRHQQGVHSLLMQHSQNEKWFIMLYFMIPSFDGEIKAILVDSLVNMGKKILSNTTDLSSEMEQLCYQYIREYAPSFSSAFRDNIIRLEKVKRRKKTLLKPIYFLRQQLINWTR
jgi:glycosyltransferase involved in cell wall biosynthesis